MDEKYGYFLPHETQCKCGCGGDIRPTLRDALNQVRRQYDGPIHITSGYRCDAYNKKVGGSINSYHTKGLAADLSLPIDRYDRERLLQATFKHPFRGRGFYKAFVHVDLRQMEHADPAYWIG